MFRACENPGHSLLRFSVHGRKGFLHISPLPFFFSFTIVLLSAWLTFYFSVHFYILGVYIRKRELTLQFSSVGQSCPTLVRPHELQHARPPCPSPTPRVYPNSRSSSRWWHPVISSSVVPFSFCPQSLPASGSFPMSQLFAWGGQSIGVSASASVLPMNTQDWSPSEWNG